MNISDVEKQTGLPSTAIRYYEERGLIQVRRKENGYRDYDEENVALLKKIRILRGLGVPLAELRLWRDGVVTLDELLTKRLHAMEDDSKRYQECRLVCEALLQGKWNDTPLPTAVEFREEIPTSPLPSCPLLLGIDVGTTTVSAQVIASDNGLCVETCLIDHNAAITLDGYPDAYAADAELLVYRVVALVASLLHTYPTVASIGITGQMHGVICLDGDGKILSPLYTWQNQFGQRKIDSQKTVCEEIESLCQKTVPTGYGLTTYYALRRMKLLSSQTEQLVTVADLVASRLCGVAPILHPTNAASLGGYDLESGDFDTALLEKLSIPRSLFPKVCDGYRILGTHRFDGREIPVAIAIGDNQAGMLGSLSRDNRILLNVGTSSQISMITDQKNLANGEIRPYFDEKQIVSGAALCGGCAYALLKDFIRLAVEGLGIEVTDRAVYEYLNHAARKASPSTLSVKTQFSGTRADPTKCGEITGITLSSFTPEALSAAFLRGIVNELHDMYRMMSDRSVEGAIVVSGNAMRKNPALREIAAEAFKKKLVLPLHTEEAAFGAALFGGIAAGILTRKESFATIHYQTTE